MTARLRRWRGRSKSRTCWRGSTCRWRASKYVPMTVGIRWRWSVANLALKHLLLMRFYADPRFARAFRYDAEDIARARRNEEQAARVRVARPRSRTLSPPSR